MLKPISRFCFGVAACAVSGIALTAVPGEAASFSFSGSRLSINNVSVLPKIKASTLATDAIAHTQQGTVDNNFDGSLDFVSKDKTRLDGLFEARSQGDGTRYFGTSDITSNAFGQFLATPQQAFSLDFQLSSFLRNTVDALQERATAKSNFSLSLLAPDGSLLKFFTLDAVVNTSLLDHGSNEVLQVQTNGQILDSNRQLLSGANEEVGNIRFLGQFEHSVLQPTLLTLRVNTRNTSCIQAPETTDACVKVPEASFLWAFSVVTALGLLVLPRQLRSSGL